MTSKSRSRGLDQDELTQHRWSRTGTGKGQNHMFNQCGIGREKALVQNQSSVDRSYRFKLHGMTKGWSSKVKSRLSRCCCFAPRSSALSALVLLSPRVVVLALALLVALSQPCRPVHPGSIASQHKVAGRGPNGACLRPTDAQLPPKPRIFKCKTLQPIRFNCQAWSVRNKLHPRRIGETNTEIQIQCTAALAACSSDQFTEKLA